MLFRKIKIFQKLQCSIDIISNLDIYLISKAFKCIDPECLFQPAHCAFRNDIHGECLLLLKKFQSLWYRLTV